MDVEYGQLAKKARDEVQTLEEPYRSLAYQTILQELIAQARKATHKEPEKEKRPVTEAPEDPVQIFLTTVVDDKKYTRLFASKGKLLVKSLAVLKLARDVLGIDGLTPPQISEILTTKFRVSKVHPQNVARDLRAATEYVHKVQSGPDFKYLLMAAGEGYLEESVNQKA